MDKFEGGYASIEELRQSLVEFKKSNKFILAYAEEYSTKAYYLASVADSVFLHPQGAVDFKGLFTQLAFFKGTLDKLEIEPEIIRHGKFKSAIEPFIYDKMSPENKEQIATFVNAIWNTMLTQIAQGRNITTQQLELIADSLLAENAQKALDLKLVDKLLYKDEFDNVLAEKSGISETSKLKFITLGKYNETAEPKTGKPFAKDKIAVIYATGEIVSGKGQADEVGSETLAKAIKNATEDANVKAIVLRVNSPGGSALASDVIWRETKLAKAKKPFIVSMGNVAASGGYYISCLADTIVAQHNTITGSIGVFGLLLNAQKMFNNKLGLTFDTYKTGPYADLGLPTRPLTSMERVKMQNSVEQVYDVFTKHVAEGRNISQANVDSIGQGRVWSGVDAMGIRLIDVYGGLNDAIAIAARAAKIDNYRIKELPEQKDALREILDDMKGETEMALMPQAVKQAANVYRFMQNKNPKDKIQARLPFGLEVE
jgi:protease-4